MREIVFLFGIDFLLLVIFIAFLLIGLIKKKGKLVILAYVFFFLFICTTVGTIYNAFKKTYHTVNELVENFNTPRNGMEIYNALFEKSDFDCLEILQYQDALVPKIDNVIWLHVATCHEEMQRIVSLKKFTVEKIALDQCIDPNSLNAGIHWLNLKSLGDTLIIYDFIDDQGRNFQTIWTNLNHSEAYVRDIYD